MFTAQIGQIKQFSEDKEALLSISADATVAQGAEKMSAHQVGCLAVLDNNSDFAGIISERDMLSKVLAKSLSPDDVLIKDIMTSSVIACDSQTPVVEAENLMAQHRIRHLPILKDNKPIGMISTRDLIEYRLASNKAMQAAAEQLAMLPTGLKSLDFEDVVSLAINEVPESFGAERAILCFEKQNSEHMIFRNSCNHSHEHLLEHFCDGTSQPACISFSQSCSTCSNGTNMLSRLVIPLCIQDQSEDNNTHQNIHGFLCMCCFNESAGQFDESQRYKAALLQQILNVNLTNAKLYQNYRHARHDSETDPLTGVGTRRVLEKVLKTECVRSLRYKCVFSIAIIDLDHFKEINDTAGHAAGDRMLKQLAKILNKNVRGTDIIITRYGGDEFVMVMPETGVSGSKILLERIRRQLRSISIPGIEQTTISCGVTEWNPSPPDTPESIMQRADEALYEAKKTGRNRIVSHSPLAVTH